MNIVTDLNTASMKAHLAAVTKLLLSSAVLKPGVTLTAGGPLDHDQKVEVGRMASLSQTDVIHLEFATNDAGSFGMVGICVFAPREQICYIFSDCQLHLAQGKSRAVILPRPEARGHFRLAPRELIHVDGKPSDASEEGILRAHARMRQLIERGACMNRQVRIEEISAHR